MLISSILILLSSNAVTQRRDKSVLYARIVITILVCCLVLVITGIGLQFQTASSDSALILEISYTSYGVYFASNGHLVSIYIASLLVSLGVLFYYLCGHLKFFFLFVPSGCPLGLLALLVLIEFISYLAKNVSLGLRLVGVIVSIGGLNLVYTMCNYVFYIYLRFSILYLNPHSANYLYFFMIFIIYLNNWLPIFITEEFLSQYTLEIGGPWEPAGGSGPAGGWGPAGGRGPGGWPAGSPGNGPQEDPFINTFKPAEPKFENERKINLKIWLNPNRDYPTFDPFIPKQVEYLNVEFHPQPSGQRGYLTYTCTQDGNPVVMRSYYIIARLGVFDVHINPDRVEVMRKGGLVTLERMDNPKWIVMKSEQMPAISMVDATKRLSFMGKFTETARKSIEKV